MAWAVPWVLCRATQAEADEAELFEVDYDCSRVPGVSGLVRRELYDSLRQLHYTLHGRRAGRVTRRRLTTLTATRHKHGQADPDPDEHCDGEGE